MGHMHLNNLNEVLVKRIFAKGSVSIRELLAICKKRGIGMSASEGEYHDDASITAGLIEVINFHNTCCRCGKTWNVEPIVNDKKQGQALQMWNDKNKDIYDMSEAQWVAFKEIKWKFAEGARAKYLKGKLETPGTITL